MHHRFINHYDEFEGDVISCLSLYNSYLHRRLSVACADEKKAVAKVTKKIYDGGLFRTPRVVEFLNEFDTFISTQFERALTEFQDYSEPIIKTPDFMRFVEKGPEVFGNLWYLLCDLRGTKLTR